MLGLWLPSLLELPPCALLPPWEKARLDMQPGVQMKGRGVLSKLDKALPTQGTLATRARGLPEPPSQRPQL